jgi:hypothetical protein
MIIRHPPISPFYGPAILEMGLQVTPLSVGVIPSLRSRRSFSADFLPENLPPDLRHILLKRLPSFPFILPP